MAARSRPCGSQVQYLDEVLLQFIDKVVDIFCRCTEADIHGPSVLEDH